METGLILLDYVRLGDANTVKALPMQRCVAALIVFASPSTIF
jgi:hypothetical protein